MLKNHCEVLKLGQNMEKVLEKISNHKECIGVFKNCFHMMKKSGKLYPTIILAHNKDYL